MASRSAFTSFAKQPKERERGGVGKDGVLIIFLLHVTVCVKRQSFYKAILPVVNIEMPIEQIFGRILCMEESFFGGKEET